MRGKGGIMSKNIFITATGTDIGKTYVSALIIKKMRESGLDCGYFKPVLSGVVAKDGKLTESDANYVVKTAGIPINADDCVTYWWKEAVSPHLASQRAGDKIDPSKIMTDFKKAEGKYDYLLVEGAGGITCPLILDENKKYLMSDLITEMNIPVLIVADGGLGTINSVLLTVGYAKQQNIKINGIILNNFNPGNFMHQDNLKQIERLTGIKVVATVEKNAKEIALLKEFFE